MNKIKCLLLTEDGFMYNYNPDLEEQNAFQQKLDDYKAVIEIFNPGIFELDFARVAGKDYDAIVVCNMPHETTRIPVRSGNVFALMQEPPYRYPYYYLFKYLEQYDKVFSNRKTASNITLSQPYLAWYFNNYQLHRQFTPPIKSKLLSCVLSKKKLLPGHRKRLRFLFKLKQTVPFDHYGNGFNHIANKEDALNPYYYSIALENYSGDYYFTEKINDCFLTLTVPLYYGCTNLDKFFPSKSYIRIDINDVSHAIKVIQEKLHKSDYQERLPYLQEAREIVLNNCHLGAFFKHEILPEIKRNMSNPITMRKLTKNWVYSLTYNIYTYLKQIKNI